MREAPGHVRAPAITSREIAELVESRHDNVRVTIERLVERGTIALPASQEKATGGRPSLEYVFSDEQGKRDSIVVVAQLSPEFTARLVDRWQELEKRAAAPADPMAVLSNPAAMRGLLLTYTEKVLALESEVAEQAPKVAALRLNR
jgi:phage regulator Rha-like protein